MGTREYDETYSACAAYFGTAPSGWLSRFLPQDGGRRVLDLGSGQGRNALHLGRLGYRVTAVDSSGEAIRELREKAEREGLPVRAVHEDIRTFSLGAGTYDVVVAVTVLCHLPPHEVEPVAGRLVRALRPEGLLLAEEFSPRDPGRMGETDASEFAPLVNNYFSAEEMQGLFRPLQPVLCRELEVVDTTHGRPHRHGLVRYAGRREKLKSE